IFSTTTMASSTTKPTAIVSAIRDILSILKLRKYMAANEPSSDKMTVTLGMAVAQRLRRNKRTTSTTSPTVNRRVNSTSSTDARMVVVRSRTVSTVIPGGI